VSPFRQWASRGARPRAIGGGGAYPRQRLVRRALELSAREELELLERMLVRRLDEVRDALAELDLAAVQDDEDELFAGPYSLAGIGPPLTRRRGSRGGSRSGRGPADDQDDEDDDGEDETDEEAQDARSRRGSSAQARTTPRKRAAGSRARRGGG
jgi:hypothetical protein